MPNGSLQDALLGRRSPELVAEWRRRLAVALDVARALHFLHAVCDPPVVHGDVKPSNVLLDARLSARLADFGLARLKPPAAAAAADEDDGDSPVAAADEAEGEAAERDRKKEPSGAEDEASVTGDTAAESTTTATATGLEAAAAPPPRSPEVDEDATTASPVEAASTSGFDRTSVDSRSGIERKKSGGKDWWWRQDNGGTAASAAGPDSGSGGVKDYVMEWIRSEIKKERPKGEWMSASGAAADDCLPKPSSGRGRPDHRRKHHHRRPEWWESLGEDKSVKKDKPRPKREWWREEFCDELSNKHKRRPNGDHHQWWPRDEDGDEEFLSPSERRRRKKHCKKSGSSSRGGSGSLYSMDWWMDSAAIGGRRSSRDWASGEIPKSGCTVSSTPSMRGTVCYVAPEYNSSGVISEKCDMYSFGVLLLVIVSGRRPLQVASSSPMSEFERANLVSWARHLAHLGRLLDLVDPSLKDVDREQALLCITVALLCIQRTPSSRPSIKEVLEMLTGEAELPHLPVEFSPSPPVGFRSKLAGRPGESILIQVR
uniref:Protein kinase domain-containing protein n=1 Tax=Ananas comosus var. bracteatus TaxID=296719 RepID=A0A6V7QUJ9_ANACO